MGETMRKNDMKKEEYTEKEEFNPLPEYTPAYPDISFFRESSVTTHEENVFCGEAPPGEKKRRRQKKKDKKEEKKKKEYALRMLLRSAVRAGAAVLAIAAVVTFISLNGGFGTKTGAAVAAALAPTARPAFNETQVYTNAQLLALWNGEENAPHKYDYANPKTVLPATCKDAGYSEYVCLECGITHKVAVAAGAHVPGAATAENVTAATCGTDGGHDDVVYCTVCGDELSRTHKTDGATGEHTPLPAVAENASAGTCTAGGKYDEVIYCAVCGKELSRETKAVVAAGHTAGDGQIKEHKDATCTEDGYTITAVYCTVCGAELNENTTVIPATGHTAGDGVEENRIEPTCTEEGSFDTVHYCSVCGVELDRVKTTVAAKGHTAGAATTENNVAATCTAAAHHDNVVYCTVCGQQLSRTTETTGNPLGHDFPAPIATAAQTPHCSRCGEAAVTLSYDKTANKFSYTIHPDYYAKYVDDNIVSLDVCDSATGVPVCEPMYSGQSGKIDAVGTTARPGDKVYIKLTLTDRYGISIGEIRSDYIVIN